MYLSDRENKEFTSSEEIHKYLEERSTTDVWSEPYICELHVIGIPTNAPILISDIKSQHANLDATDEELAEIMDTKKDGMGLLLEYPDPNGNGARIKPLRYTAYNSLFERAGLSGRSIRQTEEKTNASVLAPEVKAKFLDTCLALYGDKCKVLLRDGKVSTVRSSKYNILDTNELVTELETTLDCEWNGMQMLSAEVSHEFVVIKYCVDDSHAEKLIAKALQGTNQAGKNFKLGFKFVTSDVGNSSATVYPFIHNGTTTINFGNELGMKHSTGSSMDKWITQILPKLAILAKDTTDKVEALAKTKIKNPGGCLRNIASKLGLPKEASLKIGEDYDNCYVSCTALDIFFGLYEIAEENGKKYPNGYDTTQKLRMEDLIVSSLFFDFSECDIIFEWN